MTPRRKRATGSTSQHSGNLERSSAWAGVRRGDPVEISGTGLRQAQWEFVAHVRHVVTGEEWIEVVGGRPGDRKERSFRPEQVFAPAGKGRGRGARAPLVDAPKLPLD